MDETLKEAQQKLNITVKQIYEKLKLKSTTYSELEERISRFIKEIAWEDSDYAIFLEKKLKSLLRIEFGSLPIK